MELRPHQQKALDNVNEIFAEDNKAIVVHPTGTGKTYIALELFRQNKDKKMVFPNLEITTYQQINSDFKKSTTCARDFDADLVVFDEAHHTAATEWGKNAKALMSSHPETNFLGLTATPQRPDGIDVTKDVFDGNLADEITLEEAVATRLLKMPNYVTSLYSYEPIIEELEAGVILEEDLTEQDVNALEELYKEQISLLKEMKEVYKQKIEFHKENIKKNLDRLGKLNKNN